MKKYIATVVSLTALAFAANAAEATTSAANVAVVTTTPACGNCENNSQPEKEIKTLADEKFAATLLERFSASVTLGFESEYVFRGLHNANASINPEVDFGYDIGHGFAAYAGVWANAPVNSDDMTNEIDFYAGVTYTIKNFTFDLGYTAYTYSDNEDGDLPNSHEIKFSATYDTVDYLGEFNVSPTVAYFYDFTLGFNTLEAGATYSAPVTKWIADREWGTIDLAAMYGWTTEAHHGYSYVMLSADAVVTLNEYCSISAGVRYAYANEDDDFTNDNSNKVWFGTSLTIGF